MPALAESDLTISTAEDWNTFATNVSNGADNYSGKTVTLGADITVSTMADASAHKFCGTFNGNGHTLTLDLTNDGAEYTAPFRYVDGAAIKLLRTVGTVNGNSQQYASGLIGNAEGNVTITACHSSVAIDSSVSGDGTHGGFIGTINGTNGTVTFDNCLFDGNINASSANNCGGFVGWRNTGALTFNNCLMAGTMSLSGNDGSATFNRNGWSTLNNCYYKTSYGDVQGTQTSATGSELQTLLGSGWQVSGSSVVPIMDANDLGTAAVSGVDSYFVRTGYEIKPEPTVTAANGAVLTKNTNYTVEWSGDGRTDGAYTVTVTGAGNYTGSQSASYVVSIVPKWLNIDSSKSPGDEGYYYVGVFPKSTE